MWLNGTYGCDLINEGQMDHQIKHLSNYLQSCKASAIFLRLGYEFDNPFFGYSENPKAYVLAFQRIVQMLCRQLPSEVKVRLQFVWHSWAAPRKDVSLEDFYPGDEYVDWIGISIFQQVYPWPSGWGDGIIDWGGSLNEIDEVLTFASHHNKSTMIAESSPFGGINLNTSKTREFNKTNPWDRWYGEIITLIEKYDISMWCYINCNWDSQPMWHNTGFGDSRISSSKEVMEKWDHYVINSKGGQRFLMSGSLLYVRDPVREFVLHFESLVYPALILALLAGLVALARNTPRRLQYQRIEQS